MSLAKRRSIHLKIKVPEDKMSTDTDDTVGRKGNTKKCSKKLEFQPKSVTFLTSKQSERKHVECNRPPSPHPNKARRNNSKGGEKEMNDNEPYQ